MRRGCGGQPWGQEKVFMALIRKEEIGHSVLLMGKKQGTQVESDTFCLSPALQGPQCPPCYRPALSAKENESIQLRIHFAVKPRPVCPSECVCKWRPGSRPSPCWRTPFSILNTDKHNKRTSREDNLFCRFLED